MYRHSATLVHDEFHVEACLGFAKDTYIQAQQHTINNSDNNDNNNSDGGAYTIADFVVDSKLIHQAISALNNVCSVM